MLELGGFGLFIGGGGLNGSVGVSLDYPFPFVLPFISTGFGAGLGCGEGSVVVEDPETGEPVESVGLNCTGTGFWYTRAGIGINFDRERSTMLSLDGGFWHGVIGSDSRSFFWPMLGVGFYLWFDALP